MNIYKEDWTDPRPGVFFLNRDRLYDCRPGKIFKITEEMRLTNIIHELRAEISRLNSEFERTMQEVGRITKNATAAPMVQGETITGQLEDRVEWLKAQLVTMPGLLKKCRDARAGEAAAVQDCVKKSIRIEDLKAEVGDLKEDLAQYGPMGAFTDVLRRLKKAEESRKDFDARYVQLQEILKNEQARVEEEKAAKLDYAQKFNDQSVLAWKANQENEKNKKRVADLEAHLKAFDPTTSIGGFPPRSLAYRAIETAYQAEAMPRTIRYKVASRVFGISYDQAIHVCEALNLDSFAGHAHIEYPFDHRKS